MGEPAEPFISRPAIPKPRAIAPPVVPTQPSVPSRVFATCDGDDLAMGAVPARNVEDPAYRKHGVRRPDDWFPADPRPSVGNQVIAYAYGTCAFADMADALATAFAAEHRIYILGWSTDKGTQLKPGSGNTLEDYLKATRAQVRAMFYDGQITLTPLLKTQASGVENKWINDTINNTPNGASLIDSKLPTLGIHHQKLLVVQGQFGIVLRLSAGWILLRAASTLIPLPNPGTTPSCVSRGQPRSLAGKCLRIGGSIIRALSR